MATLLEAENFSTANIKERTSVNTNVALNDSTIITTSAQNVSVNDYVLTGQASSEQSELSLVTAKSVNTITISPNALFTHKRFESILVLKGNKLRFYRAANVDGTIPSDGSFVLLGGGTVDIDPDQLSTTYNDATGDSNYWYKFTYYNSATNVETTLADSLAIRGGNYGHYASLDEIREEAGFDNNDKITDRKISDARDEAESEINGRLVASYPLPLATPTPWIVVSVTKQLAAGLLLIDEYGTEAQSTSKDGKGKVDMARQTLADIADHNIILTDLNGRSLLTSSRTLPRGWPDSTTKDQTEDNAGGARYFSISHKF